MSIRQLSFIVERTDRYYVLSQTAWRGRRSDPQAHEDSGRLAALYADTAALDQTLGLVHLSARVGAVDLNKRGSRRQPGPPSRSSGWREQHDRVRKHDFLFRYGRERGGACSFIAILLLWWHRCPDGHCRLHDRCLLGFLR